MNITIEMLKESQKSTKQAKDNALAHNYIIATTPEEKTESKNLRAFADQAEQSHNDLFDQFLQELKTITDADERKNLAKQAMKYSQI